MNRGKIAMLLGVLALGVGVSSCGGSDEELSKAEYIEQADAICKQAEVKKNAALEEAFAKKVASGGAFSPAEEKQLVVEVAAPPVRAMVGELAELGAPSTQGDQADRIVAEFEKAITEIESDPERALTKTEQIFGPAKARAAAFGLKVCSKP